MSKTKICIASLEYLHEMLFFVQNCCLEKAFDSSDINKIIVGIEEVLVNIIRHGYSHKGHGNIEITCKDCSEKPGIQIIITDKGVPFNPLKTGEKAKKNRIDYLEDKMIGGYGISLYIRVLDVVSYERSDGTNVLYLTKYLI